jgi:hypothetical protein
MLGALELVVNAVADVDAAHGLNAKSREQEQVEGRLRLHHAFPGREGRGVDERRQRGGVPEVGRIGGAVGQQADAEAFGAKEAQGLDCCGRRHERRRVHLMAQAQRVGDPLFTCRAPGQLAIDVGDDRLDGTGRPARPARRPRLTEARDWQVQRLGNALDRPRPYPSRQRQERVPEIEDDGTRSLRTGHSATSLLPPRAQTHRPQNTCQFAGPSPPCS